MAQADVTKFDTYAVTRTSGGDEADVAKFVVYVVVDSGSTVTPGSPTRTDGNVRWLPIITQAV